jgi:hypothetical protein
MNTSLSFILVTIGIGVLISIPMVLVQLKLIRDGIVRESIWFIVIGAFLGVFIKRIWFNEISWAIFGPLIIIGGLLSLNRGDLWRTMQHGRWWWKENNNK